MSREKVIVGIDPGLSGGLVAISSSGVVLDKMKMPTIEQRLKSKHTKGKKKGQQKTQTRVDGSALFDFLFQFHSPLIFCEKAAPMFGVSTNVNFRMGHGAGVIEGIAKAMQLEWNEISPRDWQKDIWMECDIVFRQKKNERVKQSSVDTKATSLNAYERLKGDFNAVLPKCRVPHDGIVDAFLLAYYGRQR